MAAPIALSHHYYYLWFLKEIWLKGFLIIYIYTNKQSLKWKEEKDVKSLLTEYKSPDVIRNDYLYKFTGYDKDGLPGKNKRMLLLL